MDQRHCLTDQIAAYLDDDLDAAGLAEFESHLKLCSLCTSELAEQQRLLGTLSSVLTRTSEISLPTNFARVVAAQAESDMSGARLASERRRALTWCAILGVLSVALLGWTARSYVSNVVRGVSRPFGIFLELSWTAIHDAVVGLVVVLRMISRSVIPDSYAAAGFGLLLLAVAILLLSRLISNYRRLGLIE